MVGEEVVEYTNASKDLQKGAGEIVSLSVNENFEHPPHQVDLNFEVMRRFFFAERGIHGALSPIGRRYSNLIEQTESYYHSKNDVQRHHLRCSIARSAMEIRDLKRGEIRPLSSETLLLEFSGS